MKFLVAFSCLLAVASATHLGVVSPLAYTFNTPSIYNYASHAPLTYPSVHTPSVYSAINPIIHDSHLTYSVPVISPIEKTQYHAQDVLGQASYGHSEAFQTHNAVQDAAGNKAGSYSYVAPDGQVISANYVADSLGYRVASNALPVGPSVVPVAPAETPEVVAARIAHLQEHAIVKSHF